MTTASPPNSPSRYRWFRLFLGLLLIGLLGSLFALHMVRRQDRLLRAELIEDAFAVARAIHLDQLQALDGDRSDRQKPQYQRLKRQLMTTAQINPAWEWIYLMGRNADGQIYFIIDSENDEDPDPSLPGQIYEEATPLLNRVFDASLAATEGPEADSWGVWVSALVPLLDPTTGSTIAIVGIDVEASLWTSLVWRAAIVPLLLTVTLNGILVAGFLLFPRRKRSARQTRRRWRSLEASLATAGLCL